MLLCRRGAHLSKSASFKKVPEYVQQIMKIMLTSMLKPPTNPLTIHPKNDAGKYLKILSTNTTHIAILGPSLEAFALGLPTESRLFGDLVFGTSARHPRERFWPPLGHIWSDVLHFWDEFRRNVVPDVSESRPTFRYFINERHQHNLQTIKIIIKNNILKINSLKSCFTVYA